jgi:hypothetical protein
VSAVGRHEVSGGFCSTGHRGPIDMIPSRKPGLIAQCLSQPGRVIIPIIVIRIIFRFFLLFFIFHPEINLKTTIFMPDNILSDLPERFRKKDKNSHYLKPANDHQ